MIEKTQDYSEMPSGYIVTYTHSFVGLRGESVESVHSVVTDFPSARTDVVASGGIVYIPIEGGEVIVPLGNYKGTIVDVVKRDD